MSPSSSSCARALSRATLACRGWGYRTRDVIIAIVAHSRRRHRSKSFVLSSASISFRSSSRAARDTLRSLSLSRSLGQERDHLYYQKGNNSTKTTKIITLKGIETTFPRRGGRVTTTPETTVPTDLFSRFRAPSSTASSLLRAARQFWIESEIRIRIERAFASRVVRAKRPKR